MHDLLKYQLRNIGYRGALNESQSLSLIDMVNKTYNKADNNSSMQRNMLNKSSRKINSLYKLSKDNTSNKLISSEEKYRRLLLNLQPYYFFYTKNDEGRFISVSESVRDMLGFSEKEFIEHYSDFFMYGLKSDIETKNLISEYGYNIPYEVSIENKSGQLVHLELTEFLIYNENNEVTCIEGIVRDVTEQSTSKNRIYDMLYYDTLTGISNRLHLEVLMEKLLFDNHNKDNSFAMLFLDLDHFKHINDTLGHDIGDTLLQQITEGIGNSLNPDDIFARIGGDEFVIIVKDTDKIKLTLKIQLLMNLIRQSWIVNEYELKISVSMGISIYPDDGHSTVDLMKNADIAMYKSKSIGRDNFTFFKDDFNKSVHMEMQLIQNMSDALVNEEFLFYFQPKVLVSNNEVIAAEALIRWDHPEMGLIYPEKFISLAENTGFILRLGKWVIEEACKSIALFNTLNPNKKLELSINISIRQFQHENIYQVLKNAIDTYGIDGSQLSIEITESIMMENNQKMIHKLNEIKSLNVGISLDDFVQGIQHFLI